MENELKKLKVIKEQKAILDRDEKEIKKNISEMLAEKGDDKYEDDNGTVYYTHKTNLVFEKPEEEIIQELERLEISDYVETKKELSSFFVEKVKSGELAWDGISTQDKSILNVRIK